MNRIFLFLLMGAPLLLSGCFEVREELDIRDDGSGHLDLVVDLSQSQDQVRKYLQLEESNGGSLSDKNVEAILHHVRASLANVKGLSNIETETDWNRYVLTLRCDFDHPETLNRAITYLTKQLAYLYVPPIEGKSFVWTGREFRRLFDYPIDPKEYESLPSMQRYLLETARWTSIYRFPKPVRRVSNEKAEISPSRRAVKLETSIADLARGTGTLENTIDF